MKPNRKKRWNAEHLPGIHNQAWSPDDDFYLIGGLKGGSSIQFTIESITTATGGPYTGKKVATVIVEVAPCNKKKLIGESVEVVDWSECVFDLDEEELIGVWGWASEGVARSQEPGAAADALTPCHWAADDRCCV